MSNIRSDKKPIIVTVSSPHDFEDGEPACFGSSLPEAKTGYIRVTSAYTFEILTQKPSWWKILWWKFLRVLRGGY